MEAEQKADEAKQAQEEAEEEKKEQAIVSQTETEDAKLMKED